MCRCKLHPKRKEVVQTTRSNPSLKLSNIVRSGAVDQGLDFINAAATEVIKVVGGTIVDDVSTNTNLVNSLSILLDDVATLRVDLQGLAPVVLVGDTIEAELDTSGLEPIEC